MFSSLLRSKWLRGLRTRLWSPVRWDRGIESSSKHGYFSSPFCVMLFCVCRGLYDRLITSLEETYQVSKQVKETSRMWGCQCSSKNCTATEDLHLCLLFPPPLLLLLCYHSLNRLYYAQPSRTWFRLAGIASGFLTFSFFPGWGC
jgi:hypothetical protein